VKKLPNNPGIFGLCDGRWKKSSPIRPRYCRPDHIWLSELTAEVKYAE